MQTPNILGRSVGEAPDLADARAETEKVCEVAVEYTSGAIGTARVEVFKSKDDEDRGGFIFRIRMANTECSFAPMCKDLPDRSGVDLHLTGEAESVAILRALAGAIQAALGQ